MLLVVGVLTMVTGANTLEADIALAMLQLAISLLAIWTAWRFYRATTQHLVLGTEAITSSDGSVVARIDNICRVDRSMFAFKPTNGLLLHLDEPMDNRWRPGLWWRMGRRVGIGGCTPRHQAKQLAEALEARQSGR